MQKTRQQILDALNHLGKATVQDLVDELHKVRGNGITSVTVRHHINLLQKDQLICCTEMRHSNKPGRPQHVYGLTQKAHNHLPTNYRQVTDNLLLELRKHLPADRVNVIFEGVADDMASAANIPSISAEKRFDLVVEYLSQHGYEAHWEHSEMGYLLHTSNCPYHDIAQHDDALCKMDMRLIAKLVGAVPRRTGLVAEGDASCSYLFPQEAFA